MLKTPKIPLDVLVQLISWHTPEMYQVIELVARPNGGGTLVSNFHQWCWREGFEGATAGTANHPQSHGNYLCPEDEEPLRTWLVEKLTLLGIACKTPETNEEHRQAE